MGMFGKDYDKIINDMIAQTNKNTQSINDIIKAINEVNERFSGMQDLMIKQAAVQNQHGAMVKFLVNHASVDAEAQEDLEKMMKEVLKNGKIAKGDK